MFEIITIFLRLLLKLYKPNVLVYVKNRSKNEVAENDTLVLVLRFNLSFH